MCDAHKPAGRRLSFISMYLYFVLPLVLFYFLSYGNKEWVTDVHAYFGSRYVFASIVSTCYLCIILLAKPWRKKPCPLDRW